MPRVSLRRLAAADNSTDQAFNFSAGAVALAYGNHCSGPPHGFSPIGSVRHWLLSLHLASPTAPRMRASKAASSNAPALVWAWQACSPSPASAASASASQRTAAGQRLGAGFKRGFGRQGMEIGRAHV